MLLVFDNLGFFFFQAEDGIRDFHVTGVQTCALPISGMAVDRRLEGFPSVGDARLLAILPAGHASGIPEDELQDVILEGSPLEDEIGRASCRERVERLV